MLHSCGTEKILQPLEKQEADFEIINVQTYMVSIVSGGASVMTIGCGFSSRSPTM